MQKNILKLMILVLLSVAPFMTSARSFTEPPTDVFAFSAVVSGYIEHVYYNFTNAQPQYSTTTGYFLYGTSLDKINRGEGNRTTEIVITADPTNSFTKITEAMENLSENTTYYYRFCTGATGCSSKIETFTTNFDPSNSFGIDFTPITQAVGRPPRAPVVVTNRTKEFFTVNAILSGYVSQFPDPFFTRTCNWNNTVCENLTDNNQVFARFEYQANSSDFKTNPQTVQRTPEIILTDKKPAKTNYATNVKVAPNTKYYFRFCAREKKKEYVMGPGYNNYVIDPTTGEKVTKISDTTYYCSDTIGAFKTLPLPIRTVTTGNVSKVSSISASVGGIVEGKGYPEHPTSTFFEFGPDENLAKDTRSVQAQTSITGRSFINAELPSDLTPNTVYYYRACAKNTLTPTANCGITKKFKTPTVNASGLKYTAGTSSLKVETGNARDVTNTSAVLEGSGGDTDPTSQLTPTAYFRYSRAITQPVFCNDIYGAKMISTNDISLGANGTITSFSKKIENLKPDTTYYYCAFISNKDNIAFGSDKIVREFHTNCYDTVVTTKNAENIKKTSAKLNGSYCSPKTNSEKTITNKNVTTSFLYKKMGESEWKEIGEKTRTMGNFGNLYGNIFINLGGLTPNTKYLFKAKVKNNAETDSRTFEGSVLNFTTSPSTEGVNTGSGTENNTENNSYIDNSNGNNGNNNYNNTGNDNGNNNNTGNNDYYYNGGNNNNNGYNNGNGGNNVGIINTTPLTLGQNATPPNDAIVRYREGIETVFVRQIMRDIEFAKKYGYQEGSDLQNFAWNLADQFARIFGYINSSGKEIRVSQPDIAAYQLQLFENKLTVYEYYDNKIVDVRNITTVFKNASGYEYYFKK